MQINSKLNSKPYDYLYLSLDNESEESIIIGNVASLSHGDDREASTTEEEAATYKVEMEREAQIDQ